MTTNTSFKALCSLSLAALCLGHGWAASLEHGKIRARTRGWYSQDAKQNDQDSYEVAAVEGEAYLDETYEDESEIGQASKLTVEAEESVGEKESSSPRVRMGHSGKRRGKLALIGSQSKRGPSFADGYLAVGAAPVLRFSDIDPVGARPPSPALPEFNFVSSEYVPYLIEEALPEDAMNDNALLSELVIEMEPHTVVSGAIDTRRHRQEEQVEDFHLEEQRTTVLRPEEVLIFFETDTNMGSTGAVIPFSPATPNSTTIKSSATLTKE